MTESCLMEERGAWQHVQRIVMETRQQCEEFKDVVRKMMYVKLVFTDVSLKYLILLNMAIYASMVVVTVIESDLIKHRNILHASMVTVIEFNHLLLTTTYTAFILFK